VTGVGTKSITICQRVASSQKSYGIQMDYTYDANGNVSTNSEWRNGAPLQIAPIQITSEALPKIPLALGVASSASGE